MLTVSVVRVSRRSCRHCSASRATGRRSWLRTASQRSSTPTWSWCCGTGASRSRAGTPPSWLSPTASTASCGPSRTSPCTRGQRGARRRAGRRSRAATPPSWLSRPVSTTSCGPSRTSPCIRGQRGARRRVGRRSRAGTPPSWLSRPASTASCGPSRTSSCTRGQRGVRRRAGRRSRAGTPPSWLSRPVSTASCGPSRTSPCTRGQRGVRRRAGSRSRVAQQRRAQFACVTGTSFGFRTGCDDVDALVLIANCRFVTELFLVRV